MWAQIEVILMKQSEIGPKIIASRKSLAPYTGYTVPKYKSVTEGGCGVIGMASSEQVAARHMLQSLMQMRNRGNGKGGGIAAVGLVAKELGVSEEVLLKDYLLAIAYLKPGVREQLEQEYIYSVFDVDHVRYESHIEDYRSIDGLDVRPPEVYQYFVRIMGDKLEAFINEHGLQNLPQRTLEDEFVYQNTYKLNTAYYKSTGDTRAFVLSHGKNMLVYKMVGYGDDVINYYQLEDTNAHVWIGHHRYPTKGRVWHPGGAHPFIGMNEALVHNGDFANYASMSEYLAQRNIFQLFLTDTEVSVQVFDLLYRIYDYPLEYVIEALAPTTERDFTLLPTEKQKIYHMLQVTHIHASPDGPWLFLIAQSDTEKNQPAYRLTGITDTSMLRPQVFAWQESKKDDGSNVAIGFAASEKQAIDASLKSLACEDPRFWSRADRYWNARGGSYTDGGAFVFSVLPKGDGGKQLVCTDKFGRVVKAPTNSPAYHPNLTRPANHPVKLPDDTPEGLFDWFKGQLVNWKYADVRGCLRGLVELAYQRDKHAWIIETLMLLMDRRYNTGNLRRSSLLTLYDECLLEVMEVIRKTNSGAYAFLAAGDELPTPNLLEQTVVIDARSYETEGERSLGRELVRLNANGFLHFIVTHSAGHRFIGCGFGPDSLGVRIDVFGSSGDYLASGIDGMEVYIHGNAQDQLAQIMKSGKLVVYGDVGQTFMYGAKGGAVYVLGNAAGRPLINSVGKPRVVINGTCLDYLAESFMAGDPLDGGGFVVLNGITFDEQGGIVDLDTPYPGSNLFSLASGGAVYIRDPHQEVDIEQLNGGEFVEFTENDWAIIRLYLEENERLFAIPLARLLTVDGQQLLPAQVYRKIRPRSVRALQAEEAWVAHGHVKTEVLR